VNTQAQLTPASVDSELWHCGFVGLDHILLFGYGLAAGVLGMVLILLWREW